MLNNKGAQGEGTGITIEMVTAEVNKAFDSKIKGAFDDFKKNGLTDALKPHLEGINAQFTTINQGLEKLLSAGTPPPDGGQGKGLPPEVNAQLKDLNERLRAQTTEVTALKTARDQAEKRAEETERHSAIRTAIQGLPFVNEAAANTAFGLVLPNVRRLDDNSLVAGIGNENFPIDAFAKDFLQKDHGYLFRPNGATGSGAPGGAFQVRSGGRADIDSIKIGMKNEDRQAVMDSISAALATA